MRAVAFVGVSVRLLAQPPALAHRLDTKARVKPNDMSSQTHNAADIALTCSRRLTDPRALVGIEIRAVLAVNQWQAETAPTAHDVSVTKKQQDA